MDGYKDMERIESMAIKYIPCPYCEVEPEALCRVVKGKHAGALAGITHSVRMKPFNEAMEIGWVIRSNYERIRRDQEKSRK